MDWFITMAANASSIGPTLDAHYLKLESGRSEMSRLLTGLIKLEFNC